MPLYMAGARIVQYYPVSIPYHGSALNITVHSYAGLLEFGLTACRRVVSQDESYEIVTHLHAALHEIEALPSIHADADVGSAAVESTAPVVIEPNAMIEPDKVSTKKTAGARPKAPGKSSRRRTKNFRGGNEHATARCKQFVTAIIVIRRRGSQDVIFEGRPVPIPILLISYMIAYLDRVNIGYAQLQMKQTLPFDDAVYGLGAGMFFIGYFLFEVPSNLLLERIGARKTLLRIMVLWGLTASAMMFVSTPLQFYVARFLLGVFEAGFFPGVILYFTYWYPSVRRGRVIAISCR